ncbi:hypothetical protein L083_6134 [Actinoplanes sp. N902-109]|nr:hypothetical protein L083_6134 [Actinoplanes sp. N902-109]
MGADGTWVRIEQRSQTAADAGGILDCAELWTAPSSGLRTEFNEALLAFLNRGGLTTELHLLAEKRGRRSG